MKRSDYLIIAAFVAGFLILLGYMFRVSSMDETDFYEQARNNEKTVVTLDGPQVARCIDSEVTEVAYLLDNPYKYKIENFKGIRVTESDTAKMVTIHAAEKWMPLINTHVREGMLRVGISPVQVAEYYAGDSVDVNMIHLRSHDFVVAEVIMPRGKLKRVISRGNTIYVDSVKANVLKVDIVDRLVLNECAINTLDCLNSNMKELKLEDSSVDVAMVNMEKNLFKVKKVGSRSKFGGMKEF